jgi:hypothetical protein
MKHLEDTADGDAEFKTKWDKSKKDAQEFYGFDVTSPEAYPKAGFDIAQPISLAVMEPNAKHGGEPSGVVLSFGVSDEKAAIATMQNVAKQTHTTYKDDTTAQPTVHVTGQGTAMAFQDKRLYVMGGRDKTDSVQRLRDFLKQSQSKENSLQDADVFKKTLSGLPRGDQSFFVNIKSIADSNPEAAKQLKDLQGLGLSLGAKDASAFLLLDEKSEAKKFLVAGGSSRDFISQTDKPIVAITFSLAEPLKMMRSAAESTNGKKASEQMDKQLKQMLDLSPEDADALLKNAAGGILVFVSKNPKEMPTGMGYLKIADKEKAKTILTRFGAQKTDTTTGVFYKMGEMMAYGLIGDYIVFGNAVSQLEKLSKGEKGAGWTPKCGGAEILSGELAIKDALELAKNLPQSAALPGNSLSTLGKLVKLDSFGWSLNASGGGLLLTTTFEGNFKVSLSSLLLSILASEGFSKLKAGPALGGAGDATLPEPADEEGR